MYKEAFELIGKLMQNELIIQNIKITKKGFKVSWAEGSKTKYKFTQHEVESFLEIYEMQESKLK